MPTPRLRPFPRLRPLLILLHRWAGLLMAAFLFIAGLTGAVISWDHELDEWLTPHLTDARTSGPARAPLALAAVVAGPPGQRRLQAERRPASAERPDRTDRSPHRLPRGTRARRPPGGRVRPDSGRLHGGHSRASRQHRKASPKQPSGIKTSQLAQILQPVGRTPTIDPPSEVATQEQAGLGLPEPEGPIQIAAVHTVA